MKQHKNLKLLAFVGLPGSGVSTAVEYLKNKHVPSVYFGGVVLDEMLRAGIDDTPENEQTFREQLRTDQGPDVIVNKMIPEIHALASAGQHRVVLDGLYTWSEYKALKHEFPGDLTVVALVAPKHLRHRRLTDRPERPFTEAQASQRDWAEIENLEKGGPIAIADHFLPNNGSPEQLQSSIDELLRKIEF